MFLMDCEQKLILDLHFYRKQTDLTAHTAPVCLGGKLQSEDLKLNTEKKMVWVFSPSIERRRSETSLKRSVYYQGNVRMWSSICSVSIMKECFWFLWALRAPTPSPPPPQQECQHEELTGTCWSCLFLKESEFKTKFKRENMNEEFKSEKKLRQNQLLKFLRVFTGESEPGGERALKTSLFVRSSHNMNSFSL